MGFDPVLVGFILYALATLVIKKKKKNWDGKHGAYTIMLSSN